MRIISGRFKGRKFKEKIPNGVRPTTDRVKETCFNIINNLIDLEDARVLDLFSGTGSLGFEALSRFAYSCEFVDKSLKSISYIKNMANQLELNQDLVDFHNLDFRTWLKINTNHFDLIFADPPYELDLEEIILELIVESKTLKNNGIIMLETSGNKSIVQPKDLILIDRKMFGDTDVLFLELAN